MENENLSNISVGDVGWQSVRMLQNNCRIAPGILVASASSKHSIHWLSSSHKSRATQAPVGGCWKGYNVC